ncbi:phage tail tape measure protein [Brachymonas sp.]|uniref:phage tail tape measure protein n=1 Tax=Brachymonas sp. TaxID=1936292 RepID=UPI0035AE7CD3
MGAAANLQIQITTNAQQAAQQMMGFGQQSQQALVGTQQAAQAFGAQMQGSAQQAQEAMAAMALGMAAANDEIMGKTDEAQQAIEAFQQTLTQTGEVAQGFGAKMKEAMSSAFQGIRDAVPEQIRSAASTAMDVVKGIVVAAVIRAVFVPILGEIVIAVLAVVAAFKLVTAAISFFFGLFTGSSFKHDSIDSLLATSKAAEDMAKALAIGTQEAQALQDALARKGINKDDYLNTIKQAGQAMRGNQEELDRLGVAYQKMDGQYLTTTQFLQNVKQALDQYKDGADRAAAAAAMGVGSYEAVSDALKVNDADLDRSTERLQAYGLLIGPQTTEYVAQYQDSMRVFDQESQMMSEGLNRAISDQIMPVLIDLADWFKDGMPSIVATFRYSMATITSLFYGLKTAVYIAAETIIGTIDAIRQALSGVGGAVSSVLRGDLAGAADALKQGGADAMARLREIGTNITAQAVHNRNAMAQAWGFDGADGFRNERRRRAASGGGGREYHPPVDDDAKGAKGRRENGGDSGKQSAYKQYLDSLDREIEKIGKNEYAAKRLRAEQLAQKEGIKDLSGAYDRITRLQRAESQKAIDDTRDKLAEENKQYAAQTEIMRLSAREQEIATAVLKRRTDAENQIQQARKSGKPLDDQAIADLHALTEAQVEAETAMIAYRQEMQRTYQFGITKAIQTYVDDATNAANNVQNAISNAFKGMEDALVSFTTTGKMDFKSFANSVIADISRIIVRAQITSPLAGWLNGLFGGGGTGGVGSFDLTTGFSFNALGGVYSSPSLSAYSGQVVSSPTPFAFAAGAGIMGEAGPEAIMPLKRGPDGSLGVRAVGGSGSGGGDVYVTVNADTGNTAISGDGNGGQLARFGQMLGGKVRQIILDEKRPGGLLAA